MAGSSGVVTVTTPGGTATGPTFTYLHAPTIASINPVTGAAGISVTIAGTNFDAVAANNTVKFNGVAATVTSATATSIVVTSPAGGNTGVVTVATSAGTTTGPVFTYLIPPVISSINPASGSAGTSVTITGTNFDIVAANNTVEFNSVAATVTSATSTSLVVTAPAGGSTGVVSVATSGGTVNGPTYTYIVGPAVYACGEQTNGDDGYWKNSTFTKLANAASYPYAIAGSGNDIYVAGPIISNVSSPGYATYWKNGTAVQLSNQAGGFLFSVFISGTDVYFLGSADGQAFNTWKNGVISTLTTTTSASGAGLAHGNSAMFVSSTGDVYVAGFQSLTVNPWYEKATFWKNGVPTDLTNGATNAKATAIFVSGADVYVAGYEEVKSGIAIINKAPRLWKNGVSVPLTTPADNLFNDVNALLVAGTDVYVGGVYNGAGAVWKNGTMINTASYAVAEQVTSLFMYNNTDLYASGASNASGMNGYWVNGNFVEMDPGCNTASPACAHTSANQIRGIYVK
jgi:hypothetical protein